MRRLYPFHLIEAKWQKVWLDPKYHRAADPGEPGSEKPKFYILDMFPYPSGTGLHVGHPLGYTATDILARYKKMRGFNVLHPMGWDAFGLPAEQYAIQTGTHPAVTTRKNVETFKRQLIQLGFLYDWSREINTTDPGYYKWTQWIFLQLYKKGLAYVAEVPVWYCEKLGTVLANEEVLNTPEGPRSERGSHPVVRLPLRQWMLRITAFAERLIDDLDLVDWPDNLKEMQRNWIGRSEGAAVTFKVQGSTLQVEVFTTRPDTLFGATYLVLSPEHPLVGQIVTPEQREAVRTYQKQCANKSDLERTDLAKEKSGVFTGAYAVNPVNDENIPIWVADYVLISYGTGAIMAVPAHDERDWEFAKKFKLPIREVVRNPDGKSEACFSGDGIAVNSPVIEGLPTPQAKRKITAWLEERELGRRQVQYKLRDWLFSRQRYWGEPFPIVWKEDEHQPLKESELPLKLPELESYQAKSSKPGEPVLASAADWVNLPGGARREVNTMPQWAGSCWYYLRYLDPKNDKQLVDAKKEKYWMQSKNSSGGVDLYVGGAEHAVLHLLYARFWHKFLYDLGVVSTPEPFHKLVNQGMVLGEDHQKMSKSRGNVISTDEVVTRYGGDSLRLYEMFMGPLEQMKPWSMQGAEGVYRFLGRVWKLFIDEASFEDFEQTQTLGAEALGKIQLSGEIVERKPSPEELRTLHRAIKKVTADLESMSFNTAISEMMIFINEVSKWETRPKTVLGEFLKILSPFAPHLCEELWQRLGGKDSLLLETWPSHDETLLIEHEIEYIIQINGKVRDRARLPADIGKEDLEKAALASEKVKKLLDGKAPKKVIVVPKRLVNVVID